MYLGIKDAHLARNAIDFEKKQIPTRPPPLTAQSHFPIFLPVNELRQSHSVKIPAFAGMTSSAGMTIGSGAV